MARSLEIARNTRPHPNPRVGAVVVDANGVIVGEGNHIGPGNPHAEVVALRAAGAAALGATIYVTLEPCSHFGRTPPCTEAIIASGVRRAIVAVEDPDERVAGSGIEALRKAGLDVEVGLMEQEARALDPGYFHHRRTGRPMVTLKAAATLDGQVAALDGSSQWITSEEAREDAHWLRAASDAVMVGAGTLRSDDPALDVRLGSYNGPQPVPVIVAGSQLLPPNAKVLARKPIVLSPHSIEGFDTIVVPKDGATDLRLGLEALGERGIVDLLVEGGPKLASALLSAGLVDRMVLYLGAKLAGGVGRPLFDGNFLTLSQSHQVRITRVTKVGADVKLEARLEDV
ncbi:MAG TPA: bifunctional diaminohydroxyphosphoribosylaminopyrimidine deaminase/5-amino-6-(5-phosphoribosylamino)uracil reductase RibD [Acidimicrobiia bacterium]|nr:bifunctional diaminohydroxyphosphoribosylaminopyrimidine deaminase/5-amino-6-(5-phosphoribosylamino)uracil reductase RibD [Acidimicrobiia bacterium]